MYSDVYDDVTDFEICRFIKNAKISQFFYLGFPSPSIYKSQDSRGRGRQILTPLYHFHLLHKHLGISLAITVESSPLHIASKQI